MVNYISVNFLTISIVMVSVVYSVLVGLSMSVFQYIVRSFNVHLEVCPSLGSLFRWLGIFLYSVYVVGITQESHIEMNCTNSTGASIRNV